MMFHRHPIHCIMPPHILREIAENGSPVQRAQALQSYAASAQLRGQRTELTGMPTVAQTQAAAGKERIIYDAQEKTTLPGAKVRGEGDPPVDDIAVNEAYDGSGATYDLFQEVFGRNSIDGQGMRLDSTVHYGLSFDNAFWNGEQMVYGDGDADVPEEERIFNRFTAAIDVIGHELTHGVTQHEARLLYYTQPGALNESMSDVFGSLVKQRTLGQTAAEADWIIGAGLFTANVNAQGIRSMKAPGTAYDDPVLGKDPQPAHMRDYLNVSYDNGGVHINSGIPNHAFYVVAQELGGHAWEKAGHIWYRTLTDKLQFWSDFQHAANVTYDVAGQLYGKGSLEQQAVVTGWKEVGITIETGFGWRQLIALLIGLLNQLGGGSVIPATPQTARGDR